MRYQVRVLARARQDLDEIVAYAAEHSPEGAARLVTRFEEALASLEKNPFLAPICPESEELGLEVRYIQFRTRAGRKHRAIFVIVNDEVRVLRARGPGQPPIRRHDIEP